MRIRITGAVEGRLGCGLQGDGGVVLLQPRVDLIVGERHLAQSLVGALLQRGLFRPYLLRAMAGRNEVLSGGMQCIPDRRNGHRLRLRANLVENAADILVEYAVPCLESREVITWAG